MSKKISLKGWHIACVFILFAIAMAIAISYFYIYPDKGTSYFANYNQTIENELNRLIATQQEVDTTITKISESKSYTLEDPYIMVNPYGISPLSALIIFETTDEVSVSVSINDLYVTTVEPTTSHIIPIYGLYSNANNIVTLATSDGLTKTLEIVTTSYNDDTKSFELNDLVVENNYYFLLGDVTRNDSRLRGFDYNSNLVFYLDLSYVSSIAWTSNEHFYVGYNSKSSYGNTDASDLCLEMDYLGKIYSVDTDTSVLNPTYNLTIENGTYQGINHNFYADNIANYKVTTVSYEGITFTEHESVLTEDIAGYLNDADIYDGEFSLLANGKVLNITIPSGNKDTDLILVPQDGNYTYVYNLSQRTNNIVTNLSGKYALFLRINDEYYSLMTILNN